MALQVWLPLNGSIQNQGLDAGCVITGNSAYSDYGKVTQKCLNTSSNIYITPTSFSKYTQLAMSVWVYADSTKITSNWVDSIRVEDGASGLRLQVCNANYHSLGFYNNTNYKIINANLESYPMVNEYNKWHHVCITTESDKMSYYVDGVKIDSKQLQDNWNSNLVKITFINSDKIQLNDFRLYDNTLSPREIKEISKGMICHYPLNDIHATSSINKYSGDTVMGKCSHGSFACTKLEDEPGYKYTLDYTGTGSDNWKSIGFPTISYEVGKTYDYSCKVRCNSANFSLSMRASRCCNDWSTNMKTVTNADGKWHEYHLKQTMTGTTFLRSGTTDKPTTAPELEFYSQSLKTEGTVYKADIDIKDVQVSECDVNAPISNGSWNDSIVYDTSGFGNHGKIDISTAPSCQDNSPRYDFCYSFKSNQYIQTKNPINKQTNDFTISCWAKFSSNNTHTLYTSRTSIGAGIAVFFTEEKIRFDDNSQVTFDYTFSNYLNSWYHICVTRTSLAKKLYINGELVSTINQVGDMQNIGTYGTIGGSCADTNGIANGNYLNGYISDFRIYATALSDSDVLELYNSPVTITNSGVLMTQGEFKEE